MGMVKKLGNYFISDRCYPLRYLFLFYESLRLYDVAELPGKKLSQKLQSGSI